MQTDMPLVTIGMPVYNGSASLEPAIESILSQSYQNLEIIISDNNSEDNTLEICQKYASLDQRITVIQNKKNVGATENSNILMKAAAGKYFMLMAHDDIKASNFVQDCTLMLEQNKDAVLCHCNTSFYVENYSDKVCTASLGSVIGIENIFQRFYATLSTLPAVAIYGLIRVEALKKTMYFRKSIATDIAFICELSLHGEFIQVKQDLFNYISRSSWNDIHQDYKVFFGADRKPWWYIPFFFLFLDHVTRIVFLQKNPAIKLGCFATLICYYFKLFIQKIILKTFFFLSPTKYQDSLGEFLYWTMLHNPNIQILDIKKYKERFMKPIIGWRNS
ncbi:MAG TPA: hypothetical protein DHV86_02645 [Methylophilaceae bacterium]|nr:hypothetical protein [Methylophilaceae bacterium]